MFRRAGLSTPPQPKEDNDQAEQPDRGHAKKQVFNPVHRLAAGLRARYRSEPMEEVVFPVCSKVDGPCCESGFRKR